MTYIVYKVICYAKHYRFFKERQQKVPILLQGYQYQVANR